MSETDHRAVAVETFNATWDLIAAPDRDSEADRKMLATALASWFHWRHVGDAKNFSVSDWQVSRVFSLLGEGARAAEFAASSLEWARQGELSPFYVAYAHEAAARAAAVIGDEATRDRHVESAKALLGDIPEDDRAPLEADLETL